MHSDTLLRAAAWFALIVGALGLFAYLREEPAPLGDVVITTTTQVTRSVDEPKPESRKIAYTGNVKTHKFHRLSCRHAECPNCIAKFGTRDEALADGFRPCGICDP